MDYSKCSVYRVQSTLVLNNSHGALSSPFESVPSWESPGSKDQLLNNILNIYLQDEIPFYPWSDMVDIFYFYFTYSSGSKQLKIWILALLIFVHVTWDKFINFSELQIPHQ